MIDFSKNNYQDYHSSIDLIISLWRNIHKENKFKIINLLLLMVLTAITEYLFLITFSFFIYFLLSQDFINAEVSNSFLINLFNILNLTIDLNNILICLFSITLISSLLRIISLWRIHSYSAKLGNDIGTEAFKRTLAQPYDIHVNRNSNELISAISIKVNMTTDGIYNALQIIISSLIALFLVIGILSTSLYVALICIFVIGLIYLAINKFTSPKFAKHSKNIALKQDKIIKILNESFLGIREIILEKNYKFFLKLFYKNDYNFRISIAKNRFMGGVSRYFLECFMILLIILIIKLSVNSNIETSIILSMVGTFAIGFQKLLPAVQQIYASISELRTKKDSIKDVLNLLEQDYYIKVNSPKLKIDLKEIKVNSLTFKHHNQKKQLLKNIDLIINRNQMIGIVGNSGCGKSTFLDLLMGLLKPNKGQIIVNNKDIFKNKKFLYQWQNTISHVPQTIFLLDSSIKNNIAFGESEDTINRNRIKLACEFACLSELVDELPFGIETNVGERGIKLSGGQRQRIGLARAFYKSAKLLILDEATSALDDNIEKRIIENINSINDLTVIMIAHRISTLKYCDKILEFDKGTKIIYDSYNEFINFKNKKK